MDGGSGDLFVASRESGDILKVAADSEEKSAFEVFVNTGGVPNGVAFDPNGVVYICDFAHQAVLTLGSAEEGGDQQLTAIVKDYEGKSLKVRRRRLARLPRAAAASRERPRLLCAVC